MKKYTVRKTNEESADTKPTYYFGVDRVEVTREPRVVDGQVQLHIDGSKAGLRGWAPASSVTTYPRQFEISKNGQIS